MTQATHLDPSQKFQVRKQPSRTQAGRWQAAGICRQAERPRTQAGYSRRSRQAAEPGSSRRQAVIQAGSESRQNGNGGNAGRQAPNGRFHPGIHEPTQAESAVTVQAVTAGRCRCPGSR